MEEPIVSRTYRNTKRQRRTRKRAYIARTANKVEGYTHDGLTESSMYLKTIKLAINSGIVTKEMYRKKKLIVNDNKTYKHVLDKFTSNKKITASLIQDGCSSTTSHKCSTAVSSRNQKEEFLV